MARGSMQPVSAGNTTYSTTETGNPAGGGDFSLTVTGVQEFGTAEVGNTLSGSYSRRITGTDSYSMVETGDNAAGSYSETVVGTDTYSLTEQGNSGNQTYVRALVGTGSYTRMDPGAVATLPSDSGTTSYNVQESADARSGTFSQTETGSDRYGLLENFNDVSNTGGGNTPGNMNFYPVGQTFVDPDPVPTTQELLDYLRNNPNPDIARVEEILRKYPSFLAAARQEQLDQSTAF